MCNSMHLYALCTLIVDGNVTPGRSSSRICIYFDQLTPKFGLYKIPKLSQQFKQRGREKAGTIQFVCTTLNWKDILILFQHWIGQISN